MLSKKCKKFVTLLESAYKIIEEKSSRVEAERWIKLGRNNVNLLQKILLNGDVLSIGEKIAIQAAIVQIRSLIARFIKRGSGASSDKVQWTDLNTAFKGGIRTGAVINIRHKDLSEFLDDAKRLICVRLRKIVNGTRKKRGRSVKVNTVLMAKFRVTKSHEIVEETYTFGTRNEIILRTTNIDEWFANHVKEKLLAKVEEFEQKDSGWAMTDIMSVTANINKYTPLRGGLSSFVAVPTDLQLKRAIINIKNNEPYCFLWAITAALSRPVTHNERTSSYQHFNKILDYETFSFPMKLSSIPRFEKLNSLSINVYCVERRNRTSDIVPIYLSKHKSVRRTIHLLMLETEIDTRGNDGKPVYHFAWIKNLSRLVSSQISKHKAAKWVCDRCLSHFQTEAVLNKHVRDCFEINRCKVILPEEDTSLSFKNHRNKVSVPFAIYADLECILEPTNTEIGKNSIGYQKHVPHSVGLYLHCAYDDSLSQFETYRGKDCIEWFMKKFQGLAESISPKFSKVVPMESLSANQEREFKSAATCYICEKSIDDDEVKVRDHCHFTGKYRGAAHNACNLNYQNSHVVPVIFHNLSGYDSHFLIKALATEFEGPISLLPVNKERYISFTKDVAKTVVKFRFIDSFRFMASSIEDLASNLDSEAKTITRKHCTTDVEFSLLIRKGVFPYEYLDSWDKLDDAALPSQAEFFSKLNNEHIRDEEYIHAQNVWHTFNVKSLGDYSNLYLKTDVLLLADIFENFRSTCFKTYNLDPLHYYTAPGLAFDAMLKCTGVELQLLTDVDMLLFFEKGIRAMSQSLPYHSFQWLEDFENLDIKTIADDSSTGYVLEVDLEYPRELHQQHKDFPLCAEHFKPPGSMQSKLITTLLAKKNYVIHYRNLKQCLALGMQLSKIHRVLQFEQAPWLKKYIDLNTDCRTKSTNDFEKNFYKLMNNAVFGKTMENPRKHRTVKLVTKWTGRNGARALIAKPTFHSCTVFENDIVIIESNKTSVKFFKPIYAGFTILDVSKIYMYDFHYNYIKNKFGEKSKLMYTDTDSLIYQFNVPDVYDTIKQDLHKFDTSDYPADNVYAMPQVNKKVLGLMKDENKDKLMTEFVGLRAKLYVYRVMGDKVTEKKRAKGVKTATLKTITFNDFRDCLLEHKDVVKHQCMIRSRKHVVETVKQQKLMLSWNDDKRMLRPGSTDTLPWGYRN